jgi:hypothetical protein
MTTISNSYVHDSKLTWIYFFTPGKSENMEPQPSTSQPKLGKRDRRLNPRIFGDDFINEKIARIDDSPSLPDGIATQSQSIQTNEEDNVDDFDFNIDEEDIENDEEPDDNEDFDFNFDEDEENDDTLAFVEPDDTYQPDETESTEISIPNPQVPQILTTGFKKVEWKHLKFGDNGMNLGRALLVAGHVRKVKEIRMPGKLPEIEGECVPQTNIREKPHKVFMDLDEKRKIVKTRCLCRDGVLCKHICGVIIYINEFREDDEKTNLSCGFNQPSQNQQNLYPKGEELEKIDNIPAKYRMPRLNFDMISDEAKEYHANLMLEAGNTNSPLYKLCQMRYQDEPTNVEDLDIPEWVKILVFVNTNDDDVPHTIAGPRNELEKEFYQNDIVFSRDEKIRLCVLTVLQCCRTWRKQRFFRITSIVHI